MLCKKHLIMIFQTRNRECSLQEAAFRIQVQMQKIVNLDINCISPRETPEPYSFGV